jgi:uncharacterized protein (TIGR02246 family)
MNVDAHLAISALKARYCRTLDTQDWTGFGDCFTEDVHFDLSVEGGVTHGRDAVVALVSQAMIGAKSAHHVHSPEISVDGDAAEAIWAMQDRVIWPAERAKLVGHGSFTGYGHYREQYVRRNNQWRIARLVLSRLIVERFPA